MTCRYCKLQQCPEKCYRMYEARIAEVEAERDRWLDRMKRLERRLAAVRRAIDPTRDEDRWLA